jgi:hypothetical protein
MLELTHFLSRFVTKGPVCRTHLNEAVFHSLLLVHGTHGCMNRHSSAWRCQIKENTLKEWRACREKYLSAGPDRN